MITWIDLTDFMQWKGNLTGIQRIQYNMSKLYIESHDDVRFFVYQEQGRRFQQVDFNPDEIVKSGIITDELSGVQASDYANRLLKLATKIRRRALKSGYITPNTPDDAVTPFGGHDTVLIMGGIWVGEFINDLALAKAKQGFKLVHFAFDMVPSLFPGYVVDWLPDAFTEYQKVVFSISEGVIAISESTAKDVRDFIKTHKIKNAPAITVVRIGEEVDELTDAKHEKPVEGLAPGYLLSVSTIEARKNHLSLFYMLREANRRGIMLPKIVIVGRNGWHTDDFRYVVERDPVARDGIIVINDADDETLVWLYKNSLFTIFPSFYEGWGMPVAESLAYGKLCLSSNVSSMPEIAGELIDYFSPYDTGKMLDVVVKYLDPSVLRAKESKIHDSFTPTSWRDMYEAVDSFVGRIAAQ